MFPVVFLELHLLIYGKHSSSKHHSPRYNVHCGFGIRTVVFDLVIIFVNFLRLNIGSNFRRESISFTVNIEHLTLLGCLLLIEYLRYISDGPTAGYDRISVVSFT